LLLTIKVLFLKL